MLFGTADINRILREVDYTVAKIIASVLGKKYITKDELALLKRRGWKDSNFKRLMPHEQAFLFGRISAALGDSVTSKMSYSEFGQFLANPGEITTTGNTAAFYEATAQRMKFFAHKFGDKLKSDIKGAVLAQDVAFEQEKVALKMSGTNLTKPVVNQLKAKSLKKISADIQDKFESWGQDWERIVATECQDSFNMGRAWELMEEEPEALVYFHVFPGACKHCIRLYLTNGIGSAPKIFDLKTLLLNGTNYGLRSKDYKPTIYAVHPWCRCQLEKLPKGYEWDKEHRRFEPPKDYKPRVPRKSRVKITVGGKKYEV